MVKHRTGNPIHKHASVFVLALDGMQERRWCTKSALLALEEMCVALLICRYGCNLWRVRVLLVVQDKIKSSSTKSAIFDAKMSTFDPPLTIACLAIPLAEDFVSKSRTYTSRIRENG